MTERGHTVPDVQALLGARSRNTVYRHLRAALGKPNGQIPDAAMMQRWAEISGGAVMANDFYVTAAVKPAGVLLPRKKRKPRDLKVSIRAARKAARFRHGRASA